MTLFWLMFYPNILRQMSLRELMSIVETATESSSHTITEKDKEWYNQNVFCTINGWSA